MMSATSHLAAVAAPAQTRIRVLLVDDAPLALWALEKLILTSATAPIGVIGAVPNLRAALDKVEVLDPDVVLFKLDAGEENTLDVLERLATKPRPRVVVYSTLRDLEILDAAIIAGARGLVTEADPVITIVQAIERVHAGDFWFHRDATARVLSRLRGSTRQKAADPSERLLSTLTPKEHDILTALLTNIGAPVRKLADLMHISEHTLRNHCTAIYGKLGVGSRIELLAFAQRNGLAGRSSTKA